MWSDGYDHSITFDPPFPDNDHLVISVMRSVADSWNTEVTYFVTAANKNGITVRTNGPSFVHQSFIWFAYYSN